MIVVDASLAAKWLFEETDSLTARAFLRRFSGEMTAPDLIEVEIGGALVRRVNRQELARDGALDGLIAWFQIVESGAVRLVSRSPERLEAAARLATGLGHPLKDCMYLALAIELGCDLATCDRPLVAKARPIYAGVRHLDEFTDTDQRP